MKILILLTLLLPLSGLAEIRSSTEVNNGGGAIVCRDSGTDKIVRAELLDVFEARELRGRQSAITDPNLSYEGKVVSVLIRMQTNSPIRAKKYQEFFRSFLAESVFVKGVNLTFVPDADNLALPRGCQLEQAAIQKTEPEFPGDKRYTINADIWEAMDSTSRAALVLHEILYREAIRWGHTNSKAVRFLNSVITSTDFFEMKQDEFQELIYAAKFGAVEKFGTMVTMTRYESGDTSYSLDTSKLFAGLRPNQVSLENKERGYKFITAPKSTFVIQMDPSGQDVLYLGGLSFFENKRMKIQAREEKANFSMKFAEESRPVEVRLNGAYQLDQSIGVEFREDSGNVWSIVRQEGGAFELDENGFPFDVGGMIQTKNPALSYLSPYMETSGNRNITPRGVLTEGRLLNSEGNQTLLTPQGRFVFEPGFVKFDEKGRLVGGRIAPGQTVETEDGKVTLEYSRQIQFLPNGLVKRLD